MTLNQIIDQVKDDVILKGYVAVIKTLNEKGDQVNGVLFRFTDSVNNTANIALEMQIGYAIQVYPEPDDIELVSLELHHPANNVIKKYIIG